MNSRARKLSSFQRREHGDGSTSDAVNRFRFRMYMREATKVNPRRGAPVAKHFHPAFDHDGVYLFAMPTMGVDTRTLFIVRAGVLYGTAVAPLDNALHIAKLLRDRRVTVKAIA